MLQEVLGSKIEQVRHKLTEPGWASEHGLCRYVWAGQAAVSGQDERPHQVQAAPVVKPAVAVNL